MRLHGFGRLAERRASKAGGEYALERRSTWVTWFLLRTSQRQKALAHFRKGTLTQLIPINPPLPWLAHRPELQQIAKNPTSALGQWTPDDAI
jgi:hypothetical protein